MRKFKFEKLVRDKIVQGITGAGNIPHWRTLNGDEYLEELKKKIVEESMEIPNTTKEKLVGELADLQEVIDNLLLALKLSKKDFSKVQNNKNDKAGSFKNKQYIEYVEVLDNSPWLKHYLSTPDKYPEIK